MSARNIAKIFVPMAALLVGPTSGWAQNYGPAPVSKLEQECANTARLDICLPYHKISCEVRGAQRACQLYAMGVNCNGGDQQQCNYYISLLKANTACLQNNQAGCAYLQQQGLY